MILTVGNWNSMPGMKNCLLQCMLKTFHLAKTFQCHLSAAENFSGFMGSRSFPVALGGKRLGENMPLFCATCTNASREQWEHSWEKGKL